MSSDQREPFLHQRYSSDEEDPKQEILYRSGRPPTSQRNGAFCTRRNLLIHSALVLVYTILSIVAVKQFQSSPSQSSTFSSQPQELTQPYDLPEKYTYIPTTFHNLSQTPYAGLDKPAESIESAWMDLMRPMNMRFTVDEMRSVNQESVALPEKGGYLGWFGVFHNLHCVHMLRKKYEKARQCNSTESESRKDMEHVDHCIELLRQSSMCRPDTSLTTFIWHPSAKEPMFNATESTHTCVNWDQWIEQNKKRVVWDDEMLRLMNPLLQHEG